MKFETKFNIGDSFWMMENNKPKQCFVEEITVDYWEELSCYTRIPRQEIYYRGKDSSIEQKDFCQTKEILLKNL